MSRLAEFIAALLLTALCALCGWLLGDWTGYRKGVSAGEQAQKAKVDAQSVLQLKALLDGSQRLITEANASSAQLRTDIAQRGQAEQAFIKDFSHALSTTAPGRAGCVFDAGVMQRLEAARQRASDSAAAGVSGRTAATVPAATSSGREQRR